MTEAEQLLKSAAIAAGNAWAPYSHYRVGAALMTKTGEVFNGCNVENASYGLTICAERAAVSNAVTAGHREFSALAVVAGMEDGFGTDKTAPFPYPCGACRQVLAEFCEQEMPVYAARIDNLSGFEELSLGALLPKSFS